jgi:hypothetical protein
MARPLRRYLVEDIIGAVILSLLVLLRGNPRSSSPRSDDRGGFGVTLPLGAYFLSICYIVKARGGVVCIYHTDNARSRRHGLAESW